MNALTDFLRSHPEVADDLRTVLVYVEDVHSKDDPVCAPARRLLNAVALPPAESTETCERCRGWGLVPAGDLVNRLFRILREPSANAEDGGQ